MIYLDLDGVQADFDKGARQVLGMEPQAFEAQYGSEEFWARISNVPNFYYNLPKMADVQLLWDFVDSVDQSATLTALPRTFPEVADHQKRRWVWTHRPAMRVFSVIGALNKKAYAGDGGILIDDRADIKPGWEAEGGKFILHTSAKDTIRQLKELLK